MNGTSTRTKQSTTKSKKNKNTRSQHSNNNQITGRSGTSIGRASDTVSNVSRVNYSNPRIIGSDGRMRISKREFIANIPATADFSVYKYEVNPGSTTTFPWLSGIAPNFEKYKFLRLEFNFQTSQSTFVPGTVILAPEFNVTDPLPTNKAQILEYAYARRSAVWENFSIRLKKEDVMNFKSYYTRIPNQLVDDLKLYDPLYLIVGTDGLSEDLNFVGEIWVDYEIEFSLPQRLDTTLVSLGNYKRVNWAGGTFTEILGTDVIGNLGNLNCIFDQANHKFSFPSGFEGVMIMETAETNYLDTGYTYSALSVTVQDGEKSSYFGSFKGSQLTGNLENCCSYVFFNIQPGGTITFNNNGFATASTDNVTFVGVVMFMTGIPFQVPVTQGKKVINKIPELKMDEKTILELFKKFSNSK